MKFPHMIGRRDVIRAALLGSITGLVGVLLFIFMLNSMSSTYTGQTQQKELIPVSSQQTEEKEENSDVFSEVFYASQHGVFSSFDAASDFVYGYPSLNTSAVIEIDGKYYVWSSVATTKEGIMKSDDPPSFSKPFTLSAVGCKEPALKNVPSLLKNFDFAKFNFEGEEKQAELPSDWQTITFALSTISSDYSVVRMHLLAHYFTENDCLKIQF